MFAGSRRLAVADHLGVSHDPFAAPAATRGVERLGTRSGAELLWASGVEGEGRSVEAYVQSAGVSIPIFARIHSDQMAERALARCGRDWSAAVHIQSRDGEPLGSIWTADDGSVFLPFDPDEVCRNYRSEGYMSFRQSRASRAAHHGAMHVYYRARGLTPRPGQIWLRRQYAHIQRRATFPHWPAETAMHDFVDMITSILAEVAGEPLPRIATWPHGYEWALVLTHDVESSAGLAALDPVLDLERGLGLRSSWNLVPSRYAVSDALVRELTDDGFEVGVHGLHHDGHDLESFTRLRQRLPAMRRAAERWSAVGFRSPGTRRRWDLMSQLCFDYDSSYPDTDPFEPQGGGCCTWLPFFNGEIVELPLTLPQDHTLFVILRHRDETVWVEKAEFLRGRGGMALIDTHPDYLLDELIIGNYRRLLERYAGDATAWKPLPRDVSAWWRRRAASRVERVGSDWMIVGPAAAEARIEFAEPREWR